MLPSGSMALSSGECAALSVQIKGLPEAAMAECETGNFGGGGGDRGHGSGEFIRVLNARAIFVITHAYVGRHTYLMRLGVKDIVGGFGGFDSIDEWGEERDSGDFAVRRFSAKSAGARSDMACFGFSLYAGHVPHTTGYRHHIAGFYCDIAGVAVTDGRIDELLDAIEYSF